MAVNFADVTDVMLRGLLAVNQHGAAGLTRPQLIEALQWECPVPEGEDGEIVIQENRPIAGIAVEPLRGWCGFFGLVNDGTRVQLAARLGQYSLHAAGINPNDQRPLDNPRSITLVPLESTDDQVSYDDWISQVRIECELRGCWVGCLEIMLGDDEVAANNVNINPRQQQTLQLLHKAVKSSLSRSIRDRLQPLVEAGVIQDTSQAWVRWVMDDFNKLRIAKEKRAKAELEQLHWKHTKTSFGTWIGQIRTKLAQCGQKFPVGYVRDSKLKELIVSNVKREQGRAGFILDTHAGHEITELDWGVERLIDDLTKMMAEKEPQGEKQCQTFAASITGVKELEAMLATSEKARDKAESEATAFYTSNQHQYNNHSQYNNYQQSGDKCCHKCRIFYNNKGLKKEKEAVWKSHNTDECFWANDQGGGNQQQQNGGGGNGKGPNNKKKKQNGVQKDQDKEKAKTKGVDKGKGKGGKGKGGKGKGKKGKGKKGNW